VREENGGEIALGCYCFGRQQNGREGVFGVGNEKKKRVLPNENFLFIFPYLYFPSLNYIMPSALLTPSLYTYTLLL